MMSEKISEIEKSKNLRTNNLKIPTGYKKGDLFFEIITEYNNLPDEIKEPPAKLFISKKRIKEFIKNEYKICEIKKCQSCKLTPTEEELRFYN